MSPARCCTRDASITCSPVVRAMRVSLWAVKPQADEQVAIRAERESIHGDLLKRAAVLASGLRPPRPEPGELVNTVVERILRTYRDGDVRTTTRQLAFTSLARVCIDHGRRRKEVLLDEDHEVAADLQEPPDTFGRRRLEKLEQREQCVLLRVNIEGLSVPKAIEACGRATRSPYAEYNKVLARFNALLREDARARNSNCASCKRSTTQTRTTSSCSH